MKTTSPLRKFTGLVAIETIGDRPIRAGLVIDRDRVVRSAPVFGYMELWFYARVKDYVARRGWKLFELDCGPR